MVDVRVEIEKAVDEFMRGVIEMAKRAAFEQLASALDGGAADRLRRRLFRDEHARGPEVARMLAAPHAEPPSATRRKGEKRKPTAITDTTERLATFIAQHPGLRVEQINRALGTTTRELALPLRKLVASGQIRTEGQKRSTTYHSTSAAPAAPSIVVAPRRRHRSSPVT